MAFSFSSRRSRRWRNCLLASALTPFLATLVAFPLPSKDVTLTAIELYDGSSGPAYVHITEVLINNKPEVRNCASAQKIDKSAYGKFPKVLLGPGATLDYGKDGVLTLTKDGSASCVLPSNLKFAKNGPFTAAELASQVVLQAKILSKGADANQPAPPLKPGVTLVFVVAPDVELAEFLRAGRAATIPQWQDYLGKFPTATHASRAKEALTSLLVADGAHDLDAYQKSLSSPAREYPALKKAKARAQEALTVLPSSDAASKLDADSRAEIAKIIAEGQSAMQAYRQALSAHTPGYAHLTTAGQLAAALTEIDPHYDPAFALENEVSKESGTLESKLQSAESLVAAKQFDPAFAAIAPYVSFAKELPRIDQIVQATYEFHIQQGQELAGKQDWDGALKEFQKASEIRETDEVAASLKSAKAELQSTNDRHAADLAIQQSQAMATAGEFIPAYELLLSLPQRQKVLVTAQMQQLAPSYVTAASEAALELKQAHDPIRGLQDELQIERAYGYLNQANSMTNDPKLRDRQQDLADKLSAWFLIQAKKYMEKPLGSGAGLCWSYLDKALAYNASNLGEVRDEKTRAAAAYQMRSTISIRVSFRDQTSRRDSAGFAEQLEDALATGLENSGLPVRIIRTGDNPPLEPNFQLIGDVLQHRPSKVPTTKSKESKFRAGSQQAPNDDWNKANREWEAAKLDLDKAQTVLQAAIARNKKKEIADANKKVTEAQKRVEDDLAKLDLTPKTLSTDIIKPYTYTETTVDLGAIVQLQFRIHDFSGTMVENSPPITRQDTKRFTILDDVSPEDTEGIKKGGTIPDEIQFLTDIENQARDALLKTARESVAKFPDEIFEKARKRWESNDAEGAAEFYILYLNSTAAQANPKRDQAQQFLKDHFNIKRTLSAQPLSASN
jgi:hypothetical protein